MDEALNFIKNGEIGVLIIENCTRIGLTMDIVGVLILFVCTSTRRIEAEIVYEAMRDITDETVEWGHSYSFQEHKRRMENSYRSIRRNRRFGRFGLILITMGFLLQLIGT